MLLLGFVSGLPLALTGSTLGLWLREEQVDLQTIGLFAAVATPYAFKFLWAPLIDAIPIPFLARWLGRRRSWLVTVQLGLAACLVWLGLADPAADPWLTAVAAFMVAVFSASQDIVIDAYRVEILEPEQQGAGAGAVVLGYRIGMIVSGAGALYLASYVSWAVTYAVMAMLLSIGMVTVLLCGEPGQGPEKMHQASASRHDMLGWLYQAVVMPFRDFMTRRHWLAILLFILLYKLADAFMGVMTNPFLIDLGFTKEQIASIVKLYGVIATIIGSLAGGSMVLRLGISRTLWICGIAHMLTNLMFVGQALVGNDMRFLALSITLENITGGMGTAAFVAFMSSLCNVQFTATQYALLSSFASFGRTWLSTPAGWFAQALGWPMFFFFATFLAIPGLICLWWLMRKLRLTGAQAA